MFNAKNWNRKGIIFYAKTGRGAILCDPDAPLDCARRRKMLRPYGFFFLRLSFFRASKACCNRYSIWPLVLLNSSPAQVSISFKTSGLMRNINAFFSAMFNVLMPRRVFFVSKLNEHLKMSATVNNCCNGTGPVQSLL